MSRGRTLLRTGLALLAAGLVIAVTWTSTSPYDAAPELAAQEAAAQGQKPAAGAEAVLRRSIAAPPRKTGNLRPRPDVAYLGQLQSIRYLGGFLIPPIPGLGRRIDKFRATYRNGTLVWQISPAQNGAPERVAFYDPAPFTPQQVIKAFSLSPAGIWATQMTIVVGALLVFALICRYVLRIRL
jgi:hypothetical protein